MNTINNYKGVSATIYNETKSSKAVNNNVAKEKDIKKRTDASNLDEVVLVEISKEAFAKLTNSRLDEMITEFRERQAIENAQKQKEFDESGAVVANVGRMIIPNIQLNDQLVNSLSSFDDSVKDAAYSIIKDNFLTYDGAIAYEDRMELISEGLEKANVLAEQYMDKEKAGEFMNVMNKLAKIGRSGQVDENGKMKYNIPRGPLVGAPDNYVNMFDIMKQHDSSAWDKFNTMMDDAIRSNDTEKQIAAMKYAMDWSKNFHRQRPDVIAEEIKRYTDWKNSL